MILKTSQQLKAKAVARAWVLQAVQTIDNKYLLESSETARSLINWLAIMLTA